MKKKISFLISALCALGACASFTACMTDSQNGTDENTEKARTKTNIVEQQNDENGDCPNGKCPEEKPETPDADEMPPMPEFRFIPHPEHLPGPATIEKNAETDNDDDESDKDGETPNDNKKPPMPAPHKGGKIKPKMPKTGK